MMGKTTGIDYVDATWNPWMGCEPVSPGCLNCYARRSWRLLGLKPGEVRRAADATFYAPLKWKEPRKIMVCSISDFFHEAADEWRYEVFEIIAHECERHTFIIPTKRPEHIIPCLYEDRNYLYLGESIPNVWILASVENQEAADKRIPELLQLREYGDWKVLGLSIEPMIEEIDVSYYLNGGPESDGSERVIQTFKPLDWIVAGGESGTKARPCNLDWVRSLRDQCLGAGVPFYFKQIKYNSKLIHTPPIDGRMWREYPNDKF